MASLLDRITVNPEQCGGRPCIRGMRVRVIDVLQLLAAGDTPDQILADFPYLEREDISAALEYAARRLDHPTLAAQVSGAGGGAVRPVLRVWVDAQLPPALAKWRGEVPGIEAAHTFDLGLLGASDAAIFDAARTAGAVVVTKDADFVDLLDRRGPPPQVVWVTTGNVTNAALRALVTAAWSRAVEILRAGEPLVELGDRRG